MEPHRRNLLVERTFRPRRSWGVVHWTQRHPTDTGCELTETWELTQQGLDFFREKYGDDAENQLADRRAAALAGIPATLVRIKEIAETAA